MLAFASILAPFSMSGRHFGKKSILGHPISRKTCKLPLATPTKANFPMHPDVPRPGAGILPQATEIRPLGARGSDFHRFWTPFWHPFFDFFRKLRKIEHHAPALAGCSGNVVQDVSGIQKSMIFRSIFHCFFMFFPEPLPDLLFLVFFNMITKKVIFGPPSKSTGLPKWHPKSHFSAKKPEKFGGPRHFSRSRNRLASKRPPGAFRTSFLSIFDAFWEPPDLIFHVFS